MNVELQAKLLRLKGFLNEINHISYSYSKIGKETPFDNLDNEKANQLVEIYENLLNQVKGLILNYENPNNTH